MKEYNESTFEKKSRLDYMCLQMFEKIKVFRCFGYLYLES